MMNFFNKTQKAGFGWDGGPLHDPTCVAYLINPDVVELKEMYVEVELRSDISYGRTLCDFFGVTGQKPNAKVATKLNCELFWNIIENGLKNYA